MSDIMRFLKSTGIYLVGNGLIKVILFLMLPVYTKYINPVDYGTYDVNITYISFLTSILFFDIWSGIMRFMFDYHNKERTKPIVAGIILFFVSSIIYTIVTFSIGRVFIKQYIFLVFLYGLFMNIQNLVGYIARGYGKNFLYMLAGIIATAVMILLNIIFLAFLKYDYSSLYISSIISYIINAIIIIIGLQDELNCSKIHIDKLLLKNLFVFSVPFSLNSIAYWFLNSYNRVVITNTMSSYENGLYAVAVKFGAIINLIVQCFQLSLQEITFEKAAEEGTGKSEYYSKVINEYIKFLSIGAICILPFIRIIYPYMINEGYRDAVNLVPLYIIAMMLSAISLYLGVIFGAIKNSRQIFISTLLGGICNVITIHALINIIGLQAANIALIVGILVNVIFRIIVLRKKIKIKISIPIVIVALILVSIQMSIYIKGNFLLNTIALCLATLVGLMCYRKNIMNISRQIKSDFLKK